ncbi:Eco57I restriction-modification methylase domain-containing protein [Flavobacterium sp. ACN6]|uniref:Eco57I restriction-modification methylase domain-containing protein n=1 Tax=Flavobacterium sp. ACN6 TaxID=1920426 RepID=UPI000BB32BA5|nr:Eco57I restriction-modification methylase domain-containing protein [Flavobacterium sp. ACN6]PBJ12208.1 Modification methylase Eco57IB [Flavobacterium sp. ACN6]
MINKKQTGSYYTPEYLAGFISKKVLSFFERKLSISILEPSVGDGSFITEFNKNELLIKLTALDINKDELKKASTKWSKKNADFQEVDFLNFTSKTKFSAVIGNPPYIKKTLLSEKQIIACKEIHKNENLSEKSVKNIWTTFLIKSTTLLKKDGVLAFVLPSELLQVKFAEEIREYLKNQFERIEIYTFNDLLFECKGQDTIVLIAYKKHDKKGEFFTNIEVIEELENNSFILKNNNLLVDSNVKWTHHFLSSEELTFLDKIKKELNTVDFYSESKPGIVTAANNFFIIDKKTENKYNLSRFTKPIIQKGILVNGSVVFDEKDFFKIEELNHPTRLLQLNDNDRISKKLSEYLSIGIDQKIQERYKCRIRNNWYVIPNISTIPDAVFFKRCHNYPKLLKNSSSALVTDSAYKVKMRNSFDLNSFIFSFYNSLTLVFAETDGRYYGGGVLELTPNEFKKLPIPYIIKSQNEFENFTNEFERKKNIEEILTRYDSEILNFSLNLNSEEITKIQKIRQKLINKRMRK